MKRIALFILPALMLLAGCSHDFDQSGFSKLQQGKTTIPEAIVLLNAEPVTQIAFPDGRTSVTWRYETVNPWRAWDTQPKMASLLFDQDGYFQESFQFLKIPLDDQAQENVQIRKGITRY